MIWRRGSNALGFSLIKAFSTNKVMSLVMSGEEEMREDRMLEEMASFYKKSYGVQRKVPEEELTEYCAVVNSGLEKEEAESLLDPVTERKVEDVLRCMHKNKIPGRDGLPVELYVKFWPILKEHLVEIVRYCVSMGTVSSTTRVGVITLKGDRRDVENWRPITLLNVGL